MVANLLLSELLFGITYIIAALVLWEFIKTKNGELRIIMITYFSVEIFVYLGSGIYFFLLWEKLTTLSLDSFAIIVTFPKVIVKLWLLKYLKHGRKKLKSF